MKLSTEIYERESRKLVPSLSSKANDFENLTSEKSAERIAQENCSEILFKAKIWREVHEKLAAQGCRLERKGSGGVLFVGDVPVKLSKVSQKLSFSKMEKRLGSFESKAADIKVEDVKKSESVRPTPDSEQYLKERKTYYKEKSEARKQLNELFAEEQKKMREIHRLEREALYKSRASWKGYGVELNALRSTLAWKHVQERTTWNESKRERRRELNKIFKKDFPAYEEWLRLHKKNRAAELWRYRESVDGVITGDEDVSIWRQSKVTENYDTMMQKQWIKNLSALLYLKHKRGATDEKYVAFADSGKRIDVVDWRNYEVVRDSLRLATEKWHGKITVNGSEAYKQICVKVAVREGIEIDNPELQELIRLEKEELAKTNDNRHLWGASMRKLSKNFKAYDEAIGADRYRVTAMYVNQNGEKRAFVLDKEPEVQSRGFTKEEIESKFPEIDRHDIKGKNMYYTPLSVNMHHILVDDMTAEKLDELKRDGYTPAVILESSPGNFQAILNVPKLHTELDLETGNRLMRDLNEKYGDPNIRASIHPHRIPGTHNNKAKHRKADGTFPKVQLIKARKCVCHKALEESKSISKKLHDDAERAKQEAMRRDFSTTGDERKALAPYDAYMVHAKDMISHFGSISDWSRFDSMISVRMYITGYTENERAQAIAAGSKDVRPPEMKDKHQWESYGRKTAKFPDTASGQIEVKKNEHKKNAWLWLEGRMERKSKDIQRR
ncbi:MAG: hypothetical protein LUC51_03210 [Cloacibacillus porcorum]|nr:hypothetical protein [Cloacibacillus porcorum]